MLVDYHLHPFAHGEGAHSTKVLRPFFERAVQMGIRELGIADHERYWKNFDYQKIRELACDYPQLTVKMGVEMDYIPGREREIEEIVDSLNGDFVIGSLHHIDGWMFDHPDYIDQYQYYDLHQLYRRYFSLMEQLSEVDTFDIIGHLDLIKIFGFQPEGRILDYALSLLKKIKKREKVVELNTNGYRKPVSQLYPGEDILKACFQLGIPVTFSSDAHQPERVGDLIGETKELAEEIGYQKVATFEQRELTLIDFDEN